MGHFSYLCPECGKEVKYREECIIFLLKDGKVIEKMEGHYDGYGRVFKDEDSYHEIRTPPIGTPNIDDARQIDEKQIWLYDCWDNLVETHFNENKGDGFAIVHKKCYKEKEPNKISKGKI